MPSTIPMALPAAVALFQAATDPDDVTISDGLLTEYPTDKYVCIGYDPDSTMAVEFTQTMAAARGQAGHSRKEEFDILCYLRVSGGDSDLPGLRTQAFALLTELEELLRVRPGVSLSDALGSGGTAQLMSGQVDQGEDSNGDAVGIRFRINCKARI